MGEFKFGVWRQALLGSLGLLSACGGEATAVNDSPSSGGTTSASVGDTGPGGTGSGHTGSGDTGSGDTGDTGSGGTGAGPTGVGGTFGTTTQAVTSGATTGSGGTQATNVVHRVEPVHCEPFTPSTESAIPPEYRGEGGAAGATEGGVAGATEPSAPDFRCEFDSDCTEAANGDCYFYIDSYDQIYEGTRCSYGCEVDADCAAGTVCECSGGNHRCVAANCVTDDDCDANQLCIRTDAFDGCSTNIHYACQTPRDECAQNSDCPGDAECDFDSEVGRHTCITQSCSPGRPFLVYGTPRRAETSRRSDWRAEVPLDPAHLTLAERRALATRWETIASMEHASIAAFARFALQLLSVGAPAELIERTHAALADETRHAQIAYGIASRYAGHDLGPAPLAMDGALAEHDFLALVINTLLEGCIGETVAAAEAAWGSDHAQDPVLKGVLADIAADEARHAELAFAFVRWAVLRDPRLAPAVLATAQQALASVEPRESNPSDAWLAQHGLLPDGQRSELRREALIEMVLPCLRAICAVDRAA